MVMEMLKFEDLDFTLFPRCVEHDISGDVLVVKGLSGFLVGPEMGLPSRDGKPLESRMAERNDNPCYYKSEEAEG